MSRFLLIYTLVVFLVFSAKPALAQTPASTSANIGSANYYQNYIPYQSPHSASMSFYNFSHAVSCLLIGQSPVAPCLELKLYRDTFGKVKSTPYLSEVNTDYGLLGGSFSLLASVVSQPPLSTSEYLNHLASESGFAEEAHAQVGGSGNRVLSPVFSLWEVSRNISYLVMITIFILIGLMVMFRQKLNPQTVVTIQMALPGLVIGLILITFSYFLASLISDVAFIGTDIVGYYFAAADGPAGASRPPLTRAFTDNNSNMISIFANYAAMIDYSNTYDLISVVTSSVPKPSWAWATMEFFAGWISAQFVIPVSGALGNLTRSPFGKIIEAALPAIAGVTGSLFTESIFAMVISWIAIFVILYSMFKLLLRLINNLLSIIFLTITAPFQFLIASLPGRQGIATNWMLNLLCNVLAFPSVVAVFYFVAFLLKGVYPTTAYNPFLISGNFSLVGDSTFPLLGGLTSKSLNLIMAFGALVATPTIPDIICKAIGKLGPSGQMLSSEIQGDIRGGQGYYNQQQGAMRQNVTNTKSAIWGDTSWHYDPKSKQWHPYVGKPGWTQLSRQGPSTPTTPGGGGGGAGRGGPTCLPSTALILTITGQKVIRDIVVGDLLYTFEQNRKTVVKVKEIVRRKVAKNHKMLNISLLDGRSLRVSPGHPNALGFDLAIFRSGDILDGSPINRSEIEAYNDDYTYDILPEGNSGTYWANDILIGSTLSNQIPKISSHTYRHKQSSQGSI